MDQIKKRSSGVRMSQSARFKEPEIDERIDLKPNLSAILPVAPAANINPPTLTRKNLEKFIKQYGNYAKQDHLIDMDSSFLMSIAETADTVVGPGKYEP